MISLNSEFILQLVSKMTLIADRIDLKSAKSAFDGLKANFKIKLPTDLMNAIDDIIENNITDFLDNYTYDLSAIR